MTIRALLKPRLSLRLAMVMIVVLAVPLARLAVLSIIMGGTPASGEN
jgi:hypothetical protein